MEALPNVKCSDIANGYYTLVNYYVPGPQSISYFVPIILLPTALALPQSVLSHRWQILLVLPICFASTVHAWIAMGGVDVISVDALLWALFLLALKDPRREFKRIWRLRPSEAAKLDDLVLVSEDQDGPRANGDAKFSVESEEATGSSSDDDRRLAKDAPRVYAQTHPTGALPRIKWTLNLLASTRLHRWLINDPHHDRHQLRLASQPSPTRTSFVLLLLLPLCTNVFLIAPLTIQLFRHDAYFLTSLPVSTPFHPTPSTPTTTAFLQRALPPRLLRTLTLGLYAHHALSMGFLLPAPLVVIGNYLTLSTLPPSTWSPHTLPAYFGPFTSVLDTGLKGLWGRWWHQHMRVMASAPGDWVADRLGLAGSGRPRWALKVVSGFGFSGLTHMGLVPPLIRGTGPLRCGIAGFFWMQGLGVLVESAVGVVWGAWVGGGRKGDRGWVMRGLRLGWVLVWLCVSIPLLRAPFRELGWWMLYPPPDGWVAPWFQGLLDGRWIP
ncbi:MAG: hypothetical protein M1828_001149 [Chrysothrix sp. TS-e1954]|nr:MAG: hypothetical protein M1828_001149 [Chrysothrix sp. TS-e1954]